VRCVRLKRFHSYGVFYVIRGDEVRLLAIHHGARDSHWLRERSEHLGWQLAGGVGIKSAPAILYPRDGVSRACCSPHQNVGPRFSSRLAASMRK
jgi:hypothetical protein